MMGEEDPDSERAAELTGTGAFQLMSFLGGAGCIALIVAVAKLARPAVGTLIAPRLRRMQVKAEDRTV
eukprot:scaffold676765_cov59-Prasinocladus_malaysianus.AAC.1